MVGVLVNIPVGDYQGEVLHHEKPLIYICHLLGHIVHFFPSISPVSPSQPAGPPAGPLTDPSAPRSAPPGGFSHSSVRAV